MVMSLASFGMILLEDYKNGDELTVWRTLNVTRPTARRARSIAATVTPSSIRGQARASVRTVAISPDRGGSAEVGSRHRSVRRPSRGSPRYDLRRRLAMPNAVPGVPPAPRGRAGAAPRRREPVIPRLDRVDQLS